MPKLALPFALAALLLAGCTQTRTAAQLGDPRSSDPNWTLGGRELEPANALPRGFETNHPIAPATGILGQTATPR